MAVKKRIPEAVPPGNEDEVVTSLPYKARGGPDAPRLQETPIFRYWVDPSRVIIRAGRTHYNPVKVPIEPGVERVTADGDPTTSDGYQVNKLGRTLVPMDLKVKAWGAEVAGYVKVKRDTDARGKVIFHHYDVWTKYEQIGASRIEIFDHDGFHDFRERVEKFMGCAPSEAIARAERARVQRTIDAAQQSSSNASRRMAETNLKNIQPPEVAATR